jgi:uncharacterized phiE125 gp8 family phage protein
VPLLTTPSPFRAVRRIVQPVVEPVSLSEIKQHLSILPEQVEDDAYLMALVASARIVCEERLHMTLTATRWRGIASRFGACACSGVEMPYPPFLVDYEHPVEVTYTDADGVDHTVDEADIRTNTVEFPGRLQVRRTIANQCCETAAVVTWWGGVLRPNEVPSPIRTAIRRLVGRMYSDRGDDAERALQQDPATDQLLASCSWAGRF